MAWGQIRTASILCNEPSAKFFLDGLLCELTQTDTLVWSEEIVFAAVAFLIHHKEAVSKEPYLVLWTTLLLCSNPCSS